MTVKEVLIKHSKLVKFPWTIKKICNAGYLPSQFVSDAIKELSDATDASEPRNAKFIKNLVGMRDALNKELQS